MSSGSTSQDSSWKLKEQGDEAQWARQKEQEQLAELRAKLGADELTERAAQGSQPGSTQVPATTRNRDEFEGGFGGQEDLEDRYATTSGEH
ncbi:hypothetical protein DL93DRAFT_2166973 [Clavulina sp. PMI_390]|nr:hypothetical protein DL93DRAFT_2166973 [Clavulina sp. PMI_390]